MEDFSLADLFDVVVRVRGITVDLLALGHLAAGLDPDHLAVVAHHDLVHLLVEHVGAAVDGAEPGEALGQLAQAVERVEVGALAVARQGVAVQLDLLDGLQGGQLKVIVVPRRGKLWSARLDR